jgi:thiamine biosynthesis lipoprotein
MAPTLTWSDASFPCMGTTARVLVIGGPPDLPTRARDRLEQLEARWSRFRATSELCRINAAATRPVVVSRDTFAVIALAVAAWRETGGLFDPTILPALEAAGYDRTFPEVAAFGARNPGRSTDDSHRNEPTPGCGRVSLDALVPAVRVPEGVRLDLGGIGKGRAADVVVGELLAAGAHGACVDLGGDVAVDGVAPEEPGWRIDLEAGLGGGPPLWLQSGGVATSTRLKRAWTRDGAPAHHLIDPQAGAPAWNGLAAVTVLAVSTAWAEVLAKAAFVAGADRGAALLADHGVTGRLLHDDGRVEELPGLDAFRA